MGDVMAETVGDDPVELVRAAGRSWGWPVGFGIVSIVLGIIITIRPRNTVGFFAVVFGIWLLIGGAYHLIKAIAAHDDAGSSRFAVAILGLLSILIGLLVLHHTFQTVAVIGFIVGIFWVIAGVTQLFAGFEAPKGQRAWLLVLGFLGTIVGIITLVYPGLSLVIIAVLMGIWLILFGILQLIVGFQLRKLEHSA